MALVHSALLQQQAKQADHVASKKDCLAPTSAPDCEKRTCSMVTTLARSADDTQSCAVQLAALLKNLVEIAAEVARIDGLLKEAEQSAPQGAEAQKWHNVSCRALMWSRDAMADRQLTALSKMKALLQDSSSLSCGVHDELAFNPDQKHWLNVDAPEFCPASKHSAAALDVGQHEAQRRGLKGAEHIGSLKEDLEKLRCYDRDCCILVRKIKPLGLQSPEKLREHFSSCGELAEVLVSHSFEKPSAKRANGRVRPAAVGFVVFRSPETAKMVLAASEEQIVGTGADAVAVAVERYEPTDADTGLQP